MSRVLLFACVAAVLAGCGDSASETLDDLESSAVETLDTAGLEDELTRQIETQTDQVRVSVDCPADVPVESGHSFECTAELESGARPTIRVTQTDDQGGLEWVVLDTP